MQPVYNAQLDAAIGPKRKTPMRYGITQSQMLKMKETGEWSSFLTKWREQRSRFLARNRHSCYICGSNQTGGIRLLQRRICQDCCSLIREIVT